MARRRSAPDEAGSRDAASFAQTLTARQLHCRELGHDWRDSRVSWDPKALVFDRALVCRSCRSVRRQVLDRRGHVLRNGYQYADGYLATKVQNTKDLSRDVFRLEALTRWLDANQEAEAV